MKFFAFIMTFLLLLCSAAFCAEYMQGEAIAVFKIPEDTNAEEFASCIAESINAEIVNTMGNMNSKEHGKLLFALVRAKDKKTSDELIAELKSNPNVLSVSRNYIHNIVK